MAEVPIDGSVSILLNPKKYPHYRVVRESASSPMYRVFEMQNCAEAQERFDMELASTGFSQVCRFEHHIAPNHCSLIMLVGEDFR